MSFVELVSGGEIMREDHWIVPAVDPDATGTALPQVNIDVKQRHRAVLPHPCQVSALGLTPGEGIGGVGWRSMGREGEAT